MDISGTMSGVKAHNEDEMERLGEDLASKAKVGNGRPSNLFLRLPETGRKLTIGLLGTQDRLRLDTAMAHREGRVALLEAYEGTEVFGFEFPYELPEYRDDENYENPEELECAGLEWTEKRGIIAREFTLKLPDGGGYSDKNHHLPELISRKRRAMARVITTQCLKSYDINAYG